MDDSGEYDMLKDGDMALCPKCNENQLLWKQHAGRLMIVEHKNGCAYYFARCIKCGDFEISTSDAMRLRKHNEAV
jgi:hypothetical protein